MTDVVARRYAVAYNSSVGESAVLAAEMGDGLLETRLDLLGILRRRHVESWLIDLRERVMSAPFGERVVVRRPVVGVRQMLVSELEADG
jgi:hypothetical protein